MSKYSLVGCAIVMACAGILATSQQAEAHRRDYLVSQDYYTAKRGEVEVELHNDMSFPEADNDDSYNSKHQIEVEYGVTDHFQLAYYEVYTWDRSNDWERDELKIEAKLRFAQAGDWPLDIALYTEYANPDGHREVHSDELENKLIVSKDFGPWNLIGNFVFGRAINHHSDWEYEYTVGVSYGITPQTRVGLEVKQGLGNSDQFEFNQRQPLYVIPGISTNITPHIHVLAGPAFGLTRVSDDLQLKSIVEVEF